MANDNMGVQEQKLRDERKEVYNGMVAVMEKMDRGETLTVEDRTEFDKREQRLEELDANLDMVVKMRKINDGREEVADTRGMSTDQNASEMEKYAESFRNWFKSGGKTEELRDDDRKFLVRGAHTSYMEMEGGTELRAPLDPNSLQTVPGQGGYMIPQGFWQNLQIALKAYGGLLNHVNIVKTASGNEMPWPTTNPTGILGSYITEANQVGFTDFNFGQGVLYAWTITSGVILASYQLLNDSAFDVDSFVTDRMGEAIGRKVAAELWTGAGSASKAMTGLQTAIAANGGSGSGPNLAPLTYSGSFGAPGYVSGDTGALGSGVGDKVYTLGSPTTSIYAASQQLVSWGALTRMIAGVDPAYRVAGKCNFFMNDTQVQLERTLTDGFGHPLWEPNTQAGQPDTILGYPVVVDNNAPSVSASTATGGGVYFGDMKRAMVVRQVDMAGTMRLNERYADYLSVGYLGYCRMDSQPNDLRAITTFSTAVSTTQ